MTKRGREVYLEEMARIKPDLAPQLIRYDNVADNAQNGAIKPHRSSSATDGRVHRMGYLGQVWLLLWKDFLQQRRNVVVTIAEILIPLFGALLLLIIRQLVIVTDVTTPTIYPSQPLEWQSSANVTHHRIGILFAPNTSMVEKVMQEVNSTLVMEGVEATLVGFTSEQELESVYRLDRNFSHNYPITIIFSDLAAATALPSRVTYKIRPQSKDDDDWNTHTVFAFYQTLTPHSRQLYYRSRFLYIQRVINEAVIKQWKPDADFSSYSWKINHLPFPPYIDDVIAEVLQVEFPVILMLSFILSVIIMSKNIVYEKEQQLKESMKLMGLTASAHWTAWFVQYFIYLTVACAIYTLFISVQMGDKKAVLVYSDPSIVFVYLLIYSVSIIAYCFFISTLINKANVAAAISGIFFFAVFFPFYFLEPNYEKMSLSAKLGASVLFNLAMSYGIKTIGLYEGTGQGAQWNSFTKPASVDDNFSLLHAMLMLILDAVVFLILTWYIDNVNPGAFGVPRPWYFPFQSSYWCGGKKIANFSIDGNGDTYKSEYFERDPVELTAGIKMVHLKKVYEKKKVAVKDSTLSMYEGQITVLLGHNGAGKTTTMSMLTGFTPPTSGTAYVNGFDICADINSVRGSLGLCPQHNILFDNLTVDEHLTFFAKLKGCPSSEIPSLVEDMAKEIGLQLKRKAYSKTLSGGQKRKLCVGIALIGGSKIVILDEPTSGMDPAARRQTWDVLQRHRAGRTMLLSTHFMDEADLLGDRIAIMAEGVIKCCGTSMFLKKLYGAGYHLVIVKAPGCDVTAITNAVQQEVSSAVLESEVGAELSYLLPEDQAAKFPQLFNRIENNCQELGITSFGTTATTMEEVFLKVGASGLSDEASERPTSTKAHRKHITCEVSNDVNGFVNPNSFSNGSAITFPSLNDKVVSNLNHYSSATNNVSSPTTHSPDTTTPRSMTSVKTDGNHVTDPSSKVNSFNPDILGFNKDFERLNSPKLELSRFYGMFVKKAIHTFRNRIMTAVQLALPVIFTIAALTVDKVWPDYVNDPPITLDLSMFDGSITAFSAGLSPTVLTQAMCSNYTALFDGDDSTEQINRNLYADLNDFYLKQASQLGLYTYLQKVIIGADFQGTGGSAGLNATAWFSGQPYHASPIASAYLMNAVARQVTANPDHLITTINHPMPKDNLAKAEETLERALALGFSIGFSMLFGMTFLTASFSYFLIKERQAGAKHLQVVSGVGPLSFWLATFAWDLINFVVPCLVLLIVFAAFQVEAYTVDNNMGLVLLLLVAFGFAVLPFVYILQFPFSTPATGFVVLIILAIVSGLFTMMTVYIMRIPSLKVVDIANVLDWVFMVIFPHYALGMGFSNFYVNKVDMDLCQEILPTVVLCDLYKFQGIINPCCPGNCGDSCMAYNNDFLAWEYPGTGRNLFFMVLQGFVYFFLTLIIEYHLPQKLSYFLNDKLFHSRLLGSEGHENEAFEAVSLGSLSPASEQSSNEDSDVAAERKRVTDGGADTEVLILKNLFKQYGSHVAVDHSCVGVPEQECFGLLGQNGAGKTTTFKMLTGDVMASGGDAVVRGYSIRTDIKRVQANLGYCPQFDALIDQMTGRETLTMYARLKGVPAKHISRVVNNLLSILMLDKHADKLTSFYSGGNKRKLSTAIALVGNPAVILLDEPSSGMDPAARRQLWNVLSQVRASGKTLVLTSHSMEECDALCTRIAIMVNGQFKCLGSPQHLKSKFGQGYTLVVKMANHDGGTIAPAQPVVDFIMDKFPGSQKFDDHQGYIHFQVPEARIPLSQLFATMEQAKSILQVEDYSVHQTTLEQIFLTFTRAQCPPREVAGRSLCSCRK